MRSVDVSSRNRGAELLPVVPERVIGLGRPASPRRSLEPTGPRGHVYVEETGGELTVDRSPQPLLGQGHRLSRSSPIGPSSRLGVGD
jgi:hypothetical protein